MNGYGIRLTVNNTPIKSRAPTDVMFFFQFLVFLKMLLFIICRGHAFQINTIMMMIALTQ